MWMRRKMLVQSITWRGTAVVAAALLVAACSRDAGRFGPPAGPPPAPAPMAAPTPQVMTQPLPPPGELYDDRRFDDDQRFDREGGPQVAALPQDDPPEREDVLGQWSVASDYDRCQLNIALTSWDGGYRASTRGCSAPELTNIGAWNIEGDLVVLKDGEGNPLGRLARSGPSRFEGRLELGGAVSMSR